MRAVIQRVGQSSVSVEGNPIAAIRNGLLVFLGVGKADTEVDADYLVTKITNLRIFEDINGKMNCSLLETGGEMLVVSQFTLYADSRKGRRPSFTDAAGPDLARELYGYFVRQAAAAGVQVQTGRFQSLMSVALVNDGPVTLIIESPDSQN
jgi:D-tyrosyl-tRNA(Tyr) deacylase